ncbi:MAG TPA: hypothetical protein VEA79_07505 [Phenylobacterium sp.]|nr:hypothetical protein [Phenylobacterium sp.]
MQRLDLDDLPPRIAQLLTSVAEGEELLLVQGGAVAGRLTGGAPVALPEPEDEPDPQITPGEIMEQFRSMMEDDF